MAEPTIVCPKCSHDIKLTESLAAPLLTAAKEEFEKKISEKELEISKRENSIKDQEKILKEAKSQIDEEVRKKLESARAEIAKEELIKAKRLAESDLKKQATELAQTKELLAQQDAKLAEAQKAQLEVMKKNRELDDAKRELALTVEKQVQASLEQVRIKTKKDTEELLSLKVKEKEVQIASMQRTIEELKQKAEQGSQQLQGEVMELELEEMLKSKFPQDGIEPVPKGEFGGDVIQRVFSSSGQVCGAILWETKRTKNWHNGWLPKLREDQRKAKAEISILISTAMHKEIETFGQMDGVWVSAPQFMVPLAIALRQTLIEVANSKQLQQGQKTKMQLVYEYLTGPTFRHRIEAVVEKITDMQADLEKEKKTTQRLWAKREAQISGVIASTVGMYGDLQGIAGKALQEIEGLEIPLIEE